MNFGFIVFVIVFVAAMLWAARTMARLPRKDTYDSRDWIFWSWTGNHDSFDDVGDNEDNR